jgi:predicted N-acetyltransferase YhbS
MQLETLLTPTLTADQAMGIGKLIATTWPNPDKPVEYRAQQMLDAGQHYQGEALQAPRSFVIRESGVIIAHSMLIPRTLGTTAGALTIAGLARVCCDPAQRGRGLGELVVKAVFELVDAGVFPFSFFQTTSKVRSFYEKLGAAVATNRVVNSLAEDPRACPFWDEVLMRYPSSGDWPAGEIDLRGPGY